MTDQATAAATKSDEQSAGLMHIEREDATVQCVFQRTLEKLPYEDYGLSAVAELPNGRGKQTVLEGRAGAFLDLAIWAGVEGILERDSALVNANRRIHERLGEQGVKVEIEPPAKSELPQSAGEPSMVLWGPEVARLIREREPFKSSLLGTTKRRIPLALVLREIEQGAVLFFFSRKYYVLKTLEHGYFELSFSRPEPKRAIVIAVDLHEHELDRLTRWAKQLKLSKPELIRVLVRGLPTTSRGGRVAVVSGVFTEMSIEDRRRIDQLVGRWEKQWREAASARAAAVTGEVRRMKLFFGAVEELGRGRIEEALTRLEAAVKKK